MLMLGGRDEVKGRNLGMQSEVNVKQNEDKT